MISENEFNEKFKTLSQQDQLKITNHALYISKQTTRKAWNDAYGDVEVHLLQCVKFLANECFQNRQIKEACPT